MLFGFVFSRLQQCSMYWIPWWLLYNRILTENLYMWNRFLILAELCYFTLWFFRPCCDIEHIYFLENIWILEFLSRSCSSKDCSTRVQAFFQRWWRQQSPTQQKIVEALVDSGQLEFMYHHADPINQTHCVASYVVTLFPNFFLRVVRLEEDFIFKHITI